MRLLALALLAVAGLTGNPPVRVEVAVYTQREVEHAYRLGRKDGIEFGWGTCSVWWDR